MSANTDSGSVQSILAAVKARLRSIEKQWKDLDDERNVLLQTKALYERNGDGSAEPHPLAGTLAKTMAQTTAKQLKGMGPSDAVRAFIAAHPGSSATEVIDALEPVIESKSGDRRKLISWTITDLRKRGSLEKREERLYIPGRAGYVELT